MMPILPKGDGDKECVYSLCAAKPKVKCLLALISNAVGGRSRIDTQKCCSGGKESRCY